MSSESFLYLWYDAPNKKYYLGKHKGSPDDSYTHSSTVWESFTKSTIPDGVRRRILAYGTNEEMSKLEYDLLLNRQQKCWDRYYNVVAVWPICVDNSGKNNPNYGRKRSEETIKKMSEAQKGKKASEETRKKMSESQKGKKRSEETRKRMSEAQKGTNNPNYGKKASEETRKKMRESQKRYQEGRKLSGETIKKYRIGKNNPFYGKKHSEETIKKISEAKKGRKLSEETRKKMSENNKAYWQAQTEEYKKKRIKNLLNARWKKHREMKEQENV